MGVYPNSIATFDTRSKQEKDFRRVADSSVGDTSYLDSFAKGKEQADAMTKYVCSSAATIARYRAITETNLAIFEGRLFSRLMPGQVTVIGLGPGHGRLWVGAAKLMLAVTTIARRTIRFKTEKVVKETIPAVAVVLASLFPCSIANAEECKDAVDAMERYGNKVYERVEKATNDAPKLQGSGLAYYQAMCALEKASLDEARESVKLNKVRSAAATPRTRRITGTRCLKTR